MKAALLVPAAIALVVGAALAMRPRERAPRAAPPKSPGCDHGERHPPPEARPAAQLIPQATLQAELRDRSADLNALQERLSQGLADGRIAPEQILELFRAETDPAVLDLPAGVLSSNPEAADRPGVLDVFLELARSDALPARRQAALAYLGSAWDKDGRVRETLFSAARAERELNLRLTALGALQAYSIKNHEHAPAVNEGLLGFARAEATAEVRAQALAALDMRSAGESTARELAGFLADPSPEARLASADKLGEAPASMRRDLLGVLERALEREADAAIRQVLLQSLVKAGRAESAEALRRLAQRDPEFRPHAEDYLAILARGDVELEDLAREKAALEAARSK